MLGDAIDIFLNTTSAVNQKFPQKIPIETSICKNAKTEQSTTAQF